MSRSNRALKRARARGDASPRLRTTLTEPGEVIAMIPYVLGFTPADSLVVVALQGPRRRLGPTMRVDLPGSAEEGNAQAEYLVGVIGAHQLSPVLLVAYTADVSRAEAVMHPLRRGLALRRIKVAEALRADGHRWWSYTCHDPSCCSPDGMPYGADSSRVAAEAVMAGLSRAADRDALRSGLEPLSRQARLDLAEECSRRAGAYATGVNPVPGVADLDRLLLRHRAAPAEMSLCDTATLLLAVQDDGVLGAAWALLSRAGAGGDLRLWQHVMRNAPDDLLPPVGALTGFAAWLDGQGALAWHAVERVEAISPGYPMCVLLRDLLQSAVSPDVWNRLPVHRDPAS